MRSTDSYSAHSLLFVHHIMRISKFSVNIIKYPEACSRLTIVFLTLKKQSNRFELDSIPENAKCCKNNKKIIFLMPVYSGIKKMKQHGHVRTNYNNFQRSFIKPCNL